jgi:pimeloyl-ACP methyl ester carboxylesterase
MVEGQSMELAEPDGLIHRHCRVSTGLTLHVVERPGEGAPIILLHGIWGMWRSWLPLLECPSFDFIGRPVYAVDLRGHGFSDKPECGYTLPDYASDIIGLIDPIQSKQVTLVGHSLGALVSLEVATTVPDGIDKLVLEEPTIPIPERTDTLSGFWEEFVGALVGLYLLKREPHDVIVAELMRAAGNMSRDAAEEGAFSISHTADGVFGAVMEAEITTESFDHPERPLTIPSLIFQGARIEDRALSDEGVAILRRILEEPTIVTLPDTGHTPHGAQPEAFQRVLIDFIRSPVRQADIVRR